MSDFNQTTLTDDLIEKDEWVFKYLHNQLTPEQAIEFEVYIMDKPEWLEQLELDSALKANIPLATSKIVSKPRWLEYMFGTPFRAVFSTSTSCAICLILTILSSPKPSLFNGVEYLEIFYVAETRSNQGLPFQTFTPLNSSEHYVFVLSTLSPGPVKISLVNVANNQTIELAPSYPATADGEVHLSIPADKMPVGQYIFTYPIDEYGNMQRSSIIISE